MSDTTPVTVRLDRDMKSRLKAVADADDRTPHYIIKKAIEDFVSREEERQEELQILNQRQEAYDLHGISYSMEEVKQHLAERISALEKPSEALAG